MGNYPRDSHRNTGCTQRSTGDSAANELAQIKSWVTHGKGKKVRKRPRQARRGYSCEEPKENIFELKDGKLEDV